MHPYTPLRCAGVRESRTMEAGGTSVDAGTVKRWVETAAATLREQRDYLTQLDAAIGDADHGTNMDRGFTAVVAKLDGLDATPGKLLTTVGSTLVSTVGGASGPLWGTAFRRAGRALGDAPDFGPHELADALAAALAGVVELGAAQEGDKTMVDALAPAARAYRAGLGDGGAGSALDTAAAAAEEGMRATTPMLARKGRASYLGERSIGHQDPGATSAALIIGALERALAGPA
jgi:phosphoenolpyruvate---glycerone phosphotransferase subunit DhaL